ncbi:hypothetical protein Sango_1570200 [Sesamum angolense]|uniref:Transposase (putative) gypsy type domain-containing protein n=1 Tax=Sesamum angolense TaxID=2727404 RepID=A0AAE1WQ14_9LAMI|nr:hypothetical protein Sango_1570200 [Sesamum angolense]
MVASGAASYRVFRSCIKEGDVGVIRARFGIPDDFLIQVPASSKSPYSPLEDFICFYMAQLEARLRFPIPSFFLEISTLFEIPLNQLVPKAFSILVGFYILVRNLGENPSVAQFHSFFMLKKASPSLLYFTSRGDAHFLPSDSSVKEWKSHYFFVSSPIPWAFPTEWISVTPDSLSPKESICSTSSTSTSDPKGNRKSKPLSPPAKKTKVFSSSFAPPEPSTRAGTPCPSVVQIKRDKLSSTETSSLLREEAESSRVVDFVKGLLAPPNKIFLESLPRDNRPAAEEAQRKVEELERELQEKERKHKMILSHLYYEISSSQDCLDRLADFKKSDDFQCVLADSTLKYYYHGYWTCASQIGDASYPLATTSIDFLDINARLADAQSLIRRMTAFYPYTKLKRVSLLGGNPHEALLDALLDTPILNLPTLNFPTVVRNNNIGKRNLRCPTAIGKSPTISIPHRENEQGTDMVLRLARNTLLCKVLLVKAIPSTRDPKSLHLFPARHFSLPPLTDIGEKSAGEFAYLLEVCFILSALTSYLPSTSKTIMIPAMRASYSDSLFKALKLNSNAYSNSSPSGLVRTTPAPLPARVEEPCACSSQLLSSSSISVASFTNSAKAWALIIHLGL